MRKVRSIFSNLLAIGSIALGALGCGILIASEDSENLQFPVGLPQELTYEGAEVEGVQWFDNPEGSIGNVSLLTDDSVKVVTANYQTMLLDNGWSAIEVFFEDRFDNKSPSTGRIAAEKDNFSLTVNIEEDTTLGKTIVLIDLEPLRSPP